MTIEHGIRFLVRLRTHDVGDAEPLLIAVVGFDHAQHQHGCTDAQRVIREGEKAQEVLNLIEDDEDIANLVLAAATGKEGPGPLVSSISKTAGDFPIPVAIVPGHLSDEELDAMS